MYLHKLKKFLVEAVLIHAIDWDNFIRVLQKIQLLVYQNIEWDC